jgi:hypothetical protein
MGFSKTRFGLQHLMFLYMFFFSLIHPVDAWGKEGHEIVANLAWKMLSNSTKDGLMNILSNYSYGVDKNCTDECSPLAQVADWADVARYSYAYKWTAPLHYIDVQQQPCNVTESLAKNDQCYFDYTRDCFNNKCVAGAVVNDTQIVMNQAPLHQAASDPYLRRNSLMFLIHFVGDIHQPLHCSRVADKGGNSIEVDYSDSTTTNDYDTNSYHYLQSPGTHLASVDHRRFWIDNNHRKQGNLHSFWDSFMIEKSMHQNYKSSRALVEEALWFNMSQASESQWEAWRECSDGSNLTCTIQWGQESLEYALAYAYRNVDGTEIADGTTLTKEYYDSRVNVVWERLAVAGVRLASTLEKAMAATAQPAKLTPISA